MNKQFSRRGFSIIEILVVCVIIAALMGIARVAWLNRDAQNQADTCKMHLLCIEEAFNKFHLSPANRTVDPGTITLNMLKPFLPDSTLPECPAGGTYSLQATGRVTCSKAVAPAGKGNHDDGRP